MENTTLNAKPHPRGGMTKQQRRALAIAAGLCSQCHKQPHAENRRCCEDCLHKAKLYKCGLQPAAVWMTPEEVHASRAATQVRCRLKRLAAGLCLRCAQPAAPGGQCCAACAAKKAEAQRRRAKRNREVLA